MAVSTTDAIRNEVTLTTSSGGAATGYIPERSSDKLTGKITHLVYEKGTFADGVDFTITLESTGQTLWSDTNINASETVNPTGFATGSDGAELTYDGTRKIPVPLFMANDRVKIVVASGGDTKTGTFHVVLS